MLGADGRLRKDLPNAESLRGLREGRFGRIALGGGIPKNPGGDVTSSTNGYHEIGLEFVEDLIG